VRGVSSGGEELDEETAILPLALQRRKLDANTLRAEGSRLGKYVIESMIGEGGGGTVFGARHEHSGRRVAIKVLRPEMAPLPHLVTRFNREVEAINTICHPNIVEVIETGETPRGQPYYVMELLEGHNLSELLQLHGRFSPAELLELLEPLCNALKAVHEAGFVHRDVKCSNVQVTESDGQRSVKLLDFGIAKAVHDDAAAQGLTEPGARLGSVHNMAPEQVRCDGLDSRTDIYGLGVVIYRLLTGEYPFHAEDPRQIALMQLQAPPPRPSSRAPVSAGIDAVVLRCLEKQADKRFASAEELLAGFRAAVGDQPTSAAEIEESAVGVYLQLTTPADDELDDDMIEDIANVLDSAEQFLAGRGFEFPLRASQALLAVHAVDDEACNVVEELRLLLDARPVPHPAVQLAISQHIDSVRRRPSPSGAEITGGPLLEVATWSLLSP
jgi:serine/threonine protein kinase